MITPIENCQAAREYIARIGAKWKTLFTAVIEIESMGYIKEAHTIRFNRRGEIRASSNEVAPTEAEREAIADEVSRIEFPVQVKIAALANSDMPPIMLNAQSEDLFIFKDRKGEIEFIQVRVAKPDGDKRYVPQTYWSDGEWRAIEPEDGLPIYGLDQIHKGDRVFLHEGAKAAKAAQNIADQVDHPFSSFFSTGKHVGWVGGAHYVGKTKWRELAPLTGDLIIVPDNDYVGRAKINRISERFDCYCRAAMLDNMWPSGWDCADPIPAQFFSSDGFYEGQEFEDMLVGCDKATEVVATTDTGKPIFGVRERFASQWVRVQKLKHYVNINNPEVSMDREQFNVLVRPYSDVHETANLMAKMPGNICNQLTFLPGKPPGLIYYKNELQFNQYVDRRIRPRNGSDNKPFHDFMEYLFPVDNERSSILRWLRTLYAKPEVKMSYAILMLSKKQGIGKSTLMNIMAQMIGPKHVSYPGDAMIQSDFNSWLVNKRLVVVHEIYAGQNWKAYNRLKTLITEEEIDANSKHVATYTFPSSVHFMAASNSLEALRIEHDDRRWFVPQMPEKLYNRYDEVYHWMQNGGMRHLAHEFLSSEDYVEPGEFAPQTEAKSRLIDQSMPMDERLVVTLFDRMLEGQCMDVQDVWIWLQSEARGRAYVTPQRICTMLKDKGYWIAAPRKLGSRNRQLIWNSKVECENTLNGSMDSAKDQEIMNVVQNPSEVFSERAPM